MVFWARGIETLSDQGGGNCKDTKDKVKVSDVLDLVAIVYGVVGGCHAFFLNSYDSRSLKD